jgi:MscS family membrane protein
MDMDSLVSGVTGILILSKEYAWIAQAFVVVLLTLIVSYVAKKVFDHLGKVALKSNTFWDDLLIRSARKPVRLFIWLNGLLLATEVVRRVSNAPIFDFVDPVRSVTFVLVFAWFMVSFIRQGEETVQNSDNVKNPMDATTASALGKLLRLSVVITSSLVVLQSLGFSVSGVLAFGGIGGIAIGFAAKDLLANFFGGLMIYLDQPFKVGDWVRSPDQDIEGTVEHIGWRLSRIRTFDKRPIYVPNATFASITLENPSRMTNRRIFEHIGVRYDDAGKVEAIINDVEAMLKQHEAIDQNLLLMVNLNKFASSSIEFFVYTFTKTVVWKEFHQIKQDIMLKIIAIIERHGAEFAFPTQTIHLAEGAPVEASAETTGPVHSTGQ